MVKFALVASAAVVAGMVAGSAAKAQAPIILGTEDANGTNGFVGNLLASSFPTTSYLVASDGEANFDPFGFGADTSDGINFSGVCRSSGTSGMPAPGPTSASRPGFCRLASQAAGQRTTRLANRWALSGRPPPGTRWQLGLIRSSRQVGV